jgi:hypothetical protein
MSDVLTVGELLAEFMAERVGQAFSEPGTFLGPYPSGAPCHLRRSSGQDR